MPAVMPVWQPRIEFRFDPSKPLGRAALDVAVSVRRLRADGRPVPRELEKRWYASAFRAATEGRRRDRMYSGGWRGVGEIERLKAVTHGCMLLAHAIVAAERSDASPPD